LFAAEHHPYPGNNSVSGLTLGDVSRRPGSKSLFGVECLIMHRKYQDRQLWILRLYLFGKLDSVRFFKRNVDYRQINGVILDSLQSLGGIFDGRTDYQIRLLVDKKRQPITHYGMVIDYQNSAGVLPFALFFIFEVHSFTSFTIR
jgi:hypothetical protein